MKENLRNKYREIRKSITAKNRRSKVICEKILNAEVYKNSKVILAYYPLEEEVDIRSIIKQAFKDQKRVALPKTIDKIGNMEFYFIDNLTELVLGNFSIREPKAINKKVIEFQDAIILVPGIAFDFRGYRLGFGKGYYDRFLDKYKVMSIGVCYHDSLIDKLPISKYDKKVDIVITEEKCECSVKC